MAAIASVSLSIKRDARILAITGGLSSLASSLKKLLLYLNRLDGLHMPIQDREGSFLSIARDIRELHSKTITLFGTAAEKGLTNRSLVNSSIKTLRELTEELLDFAEAFDLSMETSTEESIAKALAEHQAGETVDYRSVL